MGSTPSVFISSETEKLLFNCGDGTQRLGTEHGAKVARISRIFLTSLHPRCTGGLGGMLLTRADACLPEDTTLIIGPPGTAAMVRSFRFFYARPRTKIEVQEVGDQATLPPPSSEALVVDAIVLPINVPGKRLKPASVDAVSSAHSRVTRAATTTCSYLVQLPPRRGKFLPAKALALGVKQGPDFGKLSRGESVVVDGDRVVKGEDCMEPAEPPFAALILALPSLESVQEFARNEVVAKFLKGGSEAGRLAVVVHMSPPVFREDELAGYEDQVLSLFGEGCRHIGLGEGVGAERCLSVSSLALQTAFNRLDDSVFPQRVGLAATTRRRAASELHPGECKERFVLCPNRAVGPDLSRVLPLMGATSVVPPPARTTTAMSEPQLVFLGTGAAIPSKYRNVSSFMLRWPTGAHTKSMLFDCGEGTFGQLVRAHGGVLGAVDEVTTSLQAVWISHMHADHHLGLLTVLAVRMGTVPPLLVIGPPQLGLFLKEYCAATLGDELASTYEFVDCESAAEAETVVTRRRGLSEFRSVPVDHCPHAYGIVVASPGWRVVYSGDTVPCAALVEAGKRGGGMPTTVLVHEATFADDMDTEAAEKKHSTISQAMDVARLMGVKNLVLTHFSQRYPKLPTSSSSRHNKHQGGGELCVAYAFDLMEVGFSRLPHAEMLAGRLQETLAELTKGEEEG
jgi:ribonuclease Z